MYVSPACFQILEPGQEKTLGQTDVVILLHVLHFEGRYYREFLEPFLFL